VSGIDSIRRPGLVAPEVAGAPPEVASAPLQLRVLFDSYYASIWRLLRRLGVERAQLDDATQEVFWVAARRLADIRPGSEHAFLYGVALRVASNVHRRRKARPPTDDIDDLPELADVSPTPEAELDARRARALLDMVLDALPVELRTVLVLFELEGLPVKDIAALEEIPLGTASSRLRRAREAFSIAARRVRARYGGSP
jgi:RNA polymerase sigma-70 factor (ECF subfamily)